MTRRKLVLLSCLILLLFYSGAAQTAPSLENRTLVIDEKAPLLGGSKVLTGFRFDIEDNAESDISDFQVDDISSVGSESIGSVKNFSNQTLLVDINSFLDANNGAASLNVSVTDFGSNTSSDARINILEEEDSFSIDTPVKSSNFTSVRNISVRNRGVSPLEFDFDAAKTYPGARALQQSVIKRRTESSNFFSRQGTISAGKTLNVSNRLAADDIIQDGTQDVGVVSGHSSHPIPFTNETSVPINGSFVAKQKYFVGKLTDKPLSAVNISGFVQTPESCSVLNASVQLDAGRFSDPKPDLKSSPVEYDCATGSVSVNGLQSSSSGFVTEFNYSVDIEITQNISQSSSLTWSVNKTKLTEFGNRSSGADALVDGRSSDVSVSILDDSVVATVEDDFGDSSLEKGNYTGSITYQVGKESGGGGRGGGGFDPEPGVSFENPTAPVNPGSTAVLDLEVTNEQTVENTARVSVPAESRQPQCQYFDVEQNLGRDTGFSDIGSYKLRDQGIAGRKYSTFFNVRVDLPSEQDLEGLDLENGTVTCRFTTSSTEGEAGDLVVNVEPDRSPLASLGRSLSTGLFKFGGRELELTVCREDLSQVVRPEQCGNRLVVTLPYSLLGVAGVSGLLAVVWLRRRR